MKSTNKRLANHNCQASGLCLHFATGQFTAPKVCMLNRECFHCAYDQWLDNTETVESLKDGSQVAEQVYALCA